MSEQAHTFNHSHGPCDGCEALGRAAEQAMNELATTRAALAHAEQTIATNERVALADPPGEPVNPLPALVADYFAKTRAAVKAGRVPRQPGRNSEP